MRTKILLGSVVALVAATSLYAAGSYCDNANQGINNQMMQKGQYMRGNNMSSNQGSHMQGFSKHGKKGFMLHSVIKALNLTTEQQTKMEAIMKKHMSEKTTMNNAFTTTSFDKAKFIKFASEKRDNMIKSKANMIESVYNILSAEQKLQFKVLIDLKMNKMSKRFNSDKRSYGRG